MVTMCKTSTPRVALCKISVIWLIWPSGSGQKDFLNLVNEFLQFPYYLSLEIGMTLHLNKRKFPKPKDDLCNCFVVKKDHALYQGEIITK